MSGRGSFPFPRRLTPPSKTRFRQDGRCRPAPGHDTLGYDCCGHHQSDRSPCNYGTATSGIKRAPSALTCNRAIPCTEPSARRTKPRERPQKVRETKVVSVCNPPPKNFRFAPSGPSSSQLNVGEGLKPGHAEQVLRRASHSRALCKPSPKLSKRATALSALRKLAPEPDRFRVHTCPGRARHTELHGEEVG